MGAENEYYLTVMSLSFEYSAYSKVLQWISFLFSNNLWLSNMQIDQYNYKYHLFLYHFTDLMYNKIIRG